MAEIKKNNSRRVLANVGHLFLAQGINYIFPLLTLPYLTYTLGINGFGIYAFAQVIVQYFQVFTDYGFNLTATRKLAAAQNDTQEIDSIFWSVLIVKIALGIIATVIGGVLLAFFVTDKEVRWYIFIAFLLCGVQSFFQYGISKDWNR